MKVKDDRPQSSCLGREKKLETKVGFVKRGGPQWERPGFLPWQPGEKQEIKLFRVSLEGLSPVPLRAAHGGSACPHGRPHPLGHRSSSALPRAWSSPETDCPTHLLARGNTGKGDCHRSRGWMPIFHLRHGTRVSSSPSAAGEHGSASPELTSR